MDQLHGFIANWEKEIVSWNAWLDEVQRGQSAWIKAKTDALPPLQRYLQSKLNAIRSEWDDFFRARTTERNAAVSHLHAKIAAAHTKLADYRVEIQDAIDAFADRVRELNAQIVNFDWQQLPGGWTAILHEADQIVLEYFHTASMVMVQSPNVDWRGHFVNHFRTKFGAEYGGNEELDRWIKRLTDPVDAFHEAVAQSTLSRDQALTALNERRDQLSAILSSSVDASFVQWRSDFIDAPAPLMEQIKESLKAGALNRQPSAWSVVDWGNIIDQAIEGWTGGLWDKIERVGDDLIAKIKAEGGVFAESVRDTIGHWARNTKTTVGEWTRKAKEGALFLKEEVLQQLSDSAKTFEGEFRDRFNSLTEADKQAIRARFLSEHSLSDWVSDIGKGFTTLAGDGAEWIVQRIENLGATVVEYVRESLVDTTEQFMNEVFGPFLLRLSDAGDLLFKEGKVDQALGAFVHACFLAVADLAYWEGAIILNAVIDIYAGMIGGILFGNPLTEREKQLAHSIFGDQINLTGVSLASTGLEGAGLVAGKMVYVFSRDLGNPTAAAVMAHEFTHVFQDTQLLTPGTQAASAEFLRYHVEGNNPYLLHVTFDTKWSDLDTEQQGMAVENWIRHKLGIPFDQFRGTPADLANLEHLLSRAGLFGGNPAGWTMP